MPMFRVRGTSHKTGKPITGRMKAATPERAVEHLQKIGITDTDITELPPPEGAAPPERPAPAEGRPTPRPQPKPPEPSALLIQEGTSKVEAMPVPSPEPPLHLESAPPPPPVRMPTYRTVATIIKILRTAGAVLLCIAVFVIVGLVLCIAGAVNGEPGSLYALLMLGATTIVLLFWAVLFYASAELLQMQRDVAQNSARIDERLANLYIERDRRSS